jgi:hypothetical protein
MFCSIVESFVLPMFHCRQDLACGRAIAFQCIRNDHAWDVLESFEEFAKKAFGCVFVPSALDQDIQHISILVSSPPEGMRFPVDLQIHFIQVPLVTATRTTTAQCIGVGLPKLEAPLPHRFLGHDDPTLRLVRSSTSRAAE